MASLNFDQAKRGGYIQFADRDEERRTFRLSNVSKTTADRYFVHISHLNEARRTSSSVRGETLEFLNALGKRDYKRLVKLGLVEPREPDEADKKPATLEAWLDEFERMKSPDWKPASKVVFGHTRRNLLDCFPAETLLADVTVLDAENFERHLKTEKLARATMAKRCSIARTVFEAARKHRLIESNPFQDANINVVTKGNSKKHVFVDRQDIQKILDSCPHTEWRLLIGLARYGGLRVPSEALSLKWEHINWERGEMLVPSPKTEHHEGHESRLVPLFAELRPLLLEASEQAEDGAVWVINRLRSRVKEGGTDWQAVNLRTQFQKIIKRAGLKPWVRLWVNLRSTRDTELSDEFPSHVVNKWLGHSERVANEHYRQTTRDHFERAINGITKANPSGALLVALHQEASPSITEQNPNKPSVSKPSRNAEKSKKEGVSHRSTKPQSWTILDSNQ